MVWLRSHDPLKIWGPIISLEWVKLDTSNLAHWVSLVLSTSICMTDYPKQGVFRVTFLHSLRAGVQPTVDPSNETFWIGPMCQPRESRRVDRCVWCECYVGWRRECKPLGLSSMLDISKRAPLGVAYCLTKPRLALMQRQPHLSAVQRLATWLTLLQHQPGNLVTSICFGSHVSANDTVMLLIKESATVTVYREHRQTLLLAQD